MTRTIPTSLSAALNLNASSDLPEVIPQFYAIELMFSTPLRVWTGYGDKTINGNAYVGAGTLISIEEMTESGDMTAHGVKLGVTGMDSSIITRALTEQYQGKVANIHWGVEGVSDVLLAFSGFMDVMNIEDGGSTANISITIESKLITLERASSRRYSAESHKKAIAIEGYSNANDSFFNWTTRGLDKRLAWGRDDPES